MKKWPAMEKWLVFAALIFMAASMGLAQMTAKSPQTVTQSPVYLDCHQSLRWYYGSTRNWTGEGPAVAAYPADALHGLSWCQRAVGFKENLRLFTEAQ